jgi:hypothetical protein
MPEMQAKLNSQVELDNHAESATACQPRVRQLKDGFTFEIYRILHNKKKSFTGQNEEDKWREIYQLLFPFAESVPGSRKSPAQKELMQL